MMRDREDQEYRFSTPSSAAQDADKEWTMPNKKAASTRYSALSQINTENVRNLKGRMAGDSESPPGTHFRRCCSRVGGACAAGRRAGSLRARLDPQESMS